MFCAFEVRRRLGRADHSSTTAARLLVLPELRRAQPRCGSGRADHSSTTAALLLVLPELRRAQPPCRSLIGLYYGVLWGRTM